jgi:hypothetical protein
MPIDRRKHRERRARIAAVVERSRELTGRPQAVRRQSSAAAARKHTAVALADDERKRALQRATAALKAVQAVSAASSGADRESD